MEGIALALGGGGITGGSHVGVICALEEEGIPVQYVAGTSAGAMVAVLYASGYSGKGLSRMVPEMTKKLLDYDYGGIVGRVLLPKRPFPGLIRGKRLHEYLLKAIGGRSIADLRLPFAVTATDLGNARQVLFSNREADASFLPPQTEVIREAGAVEAVLASMSIPGLFRPIRFGDRLLVDGGLMDNCPAAALKAMGARSLLAVNLVSAQPFQPRRWNISTIMSRTVNLGLHRMSQAEASYSDLVLSPDVGSISLLDFSCLPVCMEKGYESARLQMDKIRMLAEAGTPSPTHL